MMSIHNVGGPQQNQSVQSNKQVPETRVDSMMKAMTEATETIDAEVSMLKKDMLGQKEQVRDSGKQAQAQQKQGPNSQEMVDKAALAASQMTEEDQKIKKKKEKKKRDINDKKMDGLMQQMSGLEEQVDVNKLDDESKGIFQKFFGTMKKIKDLKRQLKELSMEEEEYQRLADNQ